MTNNEIYYGNGESNIFDQKKCQLPKGFGLCSICCFVMEVPSLSKPKKTVCQYQSANGCIVHATELQPTECKVFFCTTSLSNNMKWGYISYAEEQGSITPQEAQKAKKLWPIS